MPEILRPRGEEGWELSSSIPDIHDSEILDIERRVLEPLSKKSGHYVDLEGFRKEAIERFHNIGFVVDVKVFTTNVPDVYWFDFDLTRRLKEFDPDKQVWEATHDVLEMDGQDGGVIKTDKAKVQALIDGEVHHNHDDGHHHGDGGHHH